MSYYSKTYYVGDGAASTFSVPFPYLEKVDVSASVNGTPVTIASWPSASQITLSAPVGAGAVLEVKRTTTRSAPLVTYPSPFQLSALALNKSAKQAFYLVQEALDGASDGLSLSLLTDAFTARSKRISNVADPTNPSDAATKGWAETLLGFKLGGDGATWNSLNRRITNVADPTSALDAVNRRFVNDQLGPILGGVGAGITGAIYFPAALSSTNIPAPTTWFHAPGYALAGDGGEAMWVVSPVQASGAGKRQSQDGRWWELRTSIYRPEMFGAKGDATFTVGGGIGGSVTNDRIPLQEMLDYAPAGSVCQISRLHYVFPENLAAEACLFMRKPLELRSGGNKTGSEYGGGFIIAGSTDPAQDLLQIRPPLNEVWSGGGLYGLNFLTVSFDGGTGISATKLGRHMISFRCDLGNQSLSNFQIENNLIWVSNGFSIHHSGGLGFDTYACSGIEHNTIYGGIKSIYGGDSNRIIGNQLTSPGAGIDYQATTPGGGSSSHLLIEQNTIIARNYSIILRAGSRTIIRNNNCEQLFARTFGNSMVLVDPQSGSFPEIDGLVIENNLFSVASAGATGVTILVEVYKTNGLKFHGNRFAAAYVVPTGLFLGLTCVNSDIGIIRTTANITNAVSNNGTKTVGVPLAPVFVNNWVDYHVDWQPSYYFRDANGLVTVYLSIKSGTGVGIFTLPDGYRPSKQVYGFCNNPSGTLKGISIDLDGNVVLDGAVNATFLMAQVTFPVADRNAIQTNT